MWYIYMWRNKINNKIYIGKTIQIPSRRKAKHMYDARANKDDYPIHSAMRKYGINNFEFSIILECEENERLLNFLEMQYIVWYNSQVPNGYNVEAGGEGHPRPKNYGKKRKHFDQTGMKKNWCEESLQSIRESKYKRNRIVELNIEFNSIETLANYLIEQGIAKGQSKVIQSSISRVLRQGKKYHGLTIKLI